MARTTRTIRTAPDAPPQLLSARSVEIARDGITLLPPTSLDVAPGECVAVRGPNGAGKTTLLRALAGRVRPTGGTVSLLGRPVDERTSRTREAIAALIDPPALYPDLTVAEHLDLVATAWAPRAGADPAVAARDSIGAFGLEPLRLRFPHELSSGQRQLVALALAFVRPSRVLLLDEPEQRLDPERRGRLADAISAAAAGGSAIVFAAHDAELVAAVAHRSVGISA